MALTQEVRALTVHLATGQTDANYNRFTTYLRKYGARTDIHSAVLLASEKLVDIDSNGNRADELYVLYAPNTASTVATVATSDLSFANSELLQTLKALSTQVTSLSTKVDNIEARSNHEEAPNYYEANAVGQQTRNSYKEPIRTHY